MRQAALCEDARGRRPRAGGGERAMSLDFRILGPIEVSDSAGKVALGGPQQRRTLAVLLSSGGAVVSARVTRAPPTERTPKRPNMPPSVVDPERFTSRRGRAVAGAYSFGERPKAVSGRCFPERSSARGPFA